MGTTPAELRRRILKQRGVEMKKHTRKPISVDQLPTPYKKTRLMQLVELRMGKRLADFIFIGTIYEAEKKLGVDATTIYKWRRLIDETFFEQFNPEHTPTPQELRVSANRATGKRRRAK